MPRIPSTGSTGTRRTSAHMPGCTKTEYVPPEHVDEYPHREFAPGIVEMLALDYDTVAVYDHERAQALGGYAALRDSGTANLDHLAVEQLETVPTPGRRPSTRCSASRFTRAAVPFGCLASPPR